MAVLYFLAAFVMFAGAAALSKGHVWGMANGVRYPVTEGPARAPYMALLGLMPLVLGWGLWSMQNWARMITLVLSIVYCFPLAWQMVGLLAGPLNGVRGAFLVWTILQAAINAAVVYYLLQSRIARAFHEAW